MPPKVTKAAPTVVEYLHIVGSILNDVLDTVYPMAQSTCEDQQVLDCSFVDPRSGCGALMAPIGPDGIHPARSCSEVIAQQMWEAMEENCANGVPV